MSMVFLNASMFVARQYWPNLVRFSASARSRKKMLKITTLTTPYPGSWIIYSQLNPGSGHSCLSDQQRHATHPPTPCITCSIDRSVGLSWEGLTPRVDTGPRIVWSRGHSHVSKTCNLSRSWPVTRKSKTSNWPRTGHAIKSRPRNHFSHSSAAATLSCSSNFFKTTSMALLTFTDRSSDISLDA